MDGLILGAVTGVVGFLLVGAVLSVMVVTLIAYFESRNPER